MPVPASVRDDRGKRAGRLIVGIVSALFLAAALLLAVLHFSGALPLILCEDACSGESAGACCGSGAP